MRLGNQFGLPEAIVRAAHRDTYSDGGADISATSLIMPPRIRVLRREHWHEMEQDVSDRFWALMGTAVHHLLEQGAEAGHTPEERLFAKVRGWIVSGAIDIQDGGKRVVDYKVTQSYAVMNDKPDWESQLNIYAWLVEVNKDVEVEELQICAIIRDWTRSKAERDPTYPIAPIQMIDIPLWGFEERQRYVEQRVLLHQEAERAYAFGEGLIECSDEDRWVNGTKYAVIKPGNKRPTRVFSSREEAEELAGELSASVEVRPGVPVRCQYCGVDKWCDQRQRELERDQESEVDKQAG